jgi:hypothetical protein
MHSIRSMLSANANSGEHVGSPSMSSDRSNKTQPGQETGNLEPAQLKFKDEVDGSYIMVPRRASKEATATVEHIEDVQHNADATYDIVTRTEANEYYTSHSLSPVSAAERIHTEWLAKRLLLKKDRVVIEVGPRKVYREIMLSKLPQTSSLLCEVTQSELSERHIWVKEIDSDMLRLYLAYQSGEWTGGPGNWSDLLNWSELVRVVVTAKAMKDDVVKQRAMTALSKLAEKIGFSAPKMFSRDDADWVYEHTQCGDQLRAVLIVLAARSTGLITELSGPSQFLADFAAYVSDADIRTQCEQKSGGAVNTLQLHSPNGQRGYTASAHDDLHASTTQRLEARCADTSYLRPGLANTTDYHFALEEAPLRLLRPQRIPRKMDQPSQPIQPRAARQRESQQNVSTFAVSGNSQLGAQDMMQTHMESGRNVMYQTPSGPRQSEQPTQLPSRNTTTSDRFAPEPPTEMGEERTPGPHLDNWDLYALPPKPRSAAAISQDRGHGMMRPGGQAGLDSAETPRKTAGFQDPATPAPTQQNLPIRQTRQPPSTAGFQASATPALTPQNPRTPPCLPVRSVNDIENNTEGREQTAGPKYTNSVLSGRLNARTTSDAPAGGEMGQREQPVRQPKGPPAVEELKKNSKMNFAAMRNKSWRKE